MKKLNFSRFIELIEKDKNMDSYDQEETFSKNSKRYKFQNCTGEKRLAYGTIKAKKPKKKWSNCW